MKLIAMDCETIPSQKPGLYDQYVTEALNNIQPPSSYTKNQLAADLGMYDQSKIKGITRDDLIDQWRVYCADSRAQELAEQRYRKTALDGTYGELISIAAICDDHIYGACRSLDSDYSEKDLLKAFFDWINDRCKMHRHKINPYFIGHNIPFDLQFLHHRAVILQVDPGFDLPFNGVHNRHYFCNSRAWSKFGERISQNDLAAALGIEQKPDDIDGSKVWDFVKAGNVDRVNEYNVYDVLTVSKIYNRLTFNKDKLWQGT